MSVTGGQKQRELVLERVRDLCERAETLEGLQREMVESFTVDWPLR